MSNIRIHNTTSSDLGLATGQVVPAKSHLDIDEDEFARNEGSKVVEAWFNEGKLSKNGQLVGEPEPAVQSREEIVADALRAVLEAGGDDLAADGRPKVEPVSVFLVAGGHEPTNSAERDAVWETIRQNG